jgi:hypothetical protein
MSGIAESAVIARLKAVSGVSDLVAARVFPHIAPQATDKPYLIVMRPEGQINEGTAKGLTGVSRTPIIVACVGESYIESRSLAAPVVAALVPASPTGSATWNGTEIGSCQLEDSFDRSTFPQLADEIGCPVEFVTFDLEHAST